MNDFAQPFLQAAANFTQVAHSGYPDGIERAVELIVSAFSGGHKLLVFGNGGSAADAEHICAELVVRFARERRGLPALALTTNPASITACGNDLGFERIFERQVQALGSPGDVVWGISTSGTSPNVVSALRYARQAGLSTIGLTGQGGGEVGQFCDVLLAVPLRETARIQEVHLVTYHVICQLIEERLFGTGRL